VATIRLKSDSQAQDSFILSLFRVLLYSCSHSCPDLVPKY